MSKVVKLISVEKTYELRNKILRPGLPIEDCHFENDQDESSYHFGLFINSNLSTIASFHKQSHINFSQQDQYRLRGMATRATNQGLGHGSILIKEALDFFLKKNCKLIWCNARIKAVKFYERLGFTIESEEFLIEGVGPHYLMKKIL